MHINAELPYDENLTTFHHYAAHEFGHKWIQHLPVMSDGKGHWQQNINTVTPFC